MRQTKDNKTRASRNNAWPRRLPQAVFIGVVVGLAFWVLFVNNAQAPSPNPANSFAGPASPRFVYSEQQGNVAILWQTSLSQTSQRREIARIADETRYGVRASLSPLKDRLVYLVNGSQARDVYSSAQLWLLDRGNSQKQLIGEGFDINATPIWSPSGGSILLRRSLQESEDVVRTEIVAIDLVSPERRQVLVSDRASAGLYTIGWSGNGAKVYYSAIGRQGTDLMEATVANGSTRTIAHLSDKVARDYQISPDRSVVAFTSADRQGDSVGYSVQTVGLESGERKILRKDLNEQYMPAWLPDSRSLTISVAGQSSGDGRGVANAGIADAALTMVTDSPSNTFDVPVSWSPDARFLVVRSFKGTSSQNVTGDELVIVALDGARQPVPSAGYAEFVGWFGVGD